MSGILESCTRLAFILPAAIGLRWAQPPFGSRYQSTNGASQKTLDEARREGRRRRRQRRNKRRHARSKVYREALSVLRPTLGPQVALCRVLLKNGNVAGATIQARAILESFVVAEHLAAKGSLPEGIAMDAMLANLRSCQKLSSDEFIGLMKAWECLERSSKPDDLGAPSTALAALESLLTKTWSSSGVDNQRRKRRFQREGSRLMDRFDPSPEAQDRAEMVSHA
ncbi:MAG: hypothetical protein AAGJ40_09110 [Planctomycetota bacterium]